MKSFLIGSAMKISAALIIPLLMFYCGVPHKIAVTIGVLIAIVGFILQVRAAFKIHAEYERDVMRAKLDAVDLMASFKDLPPEAAIRIALNVKDLR